MYEDRVEFLSLPKEQRIALFRALARTSGTRESVLRVFGLQEEDFKGTRPQVDFCFHEWHDETCPQCGSILRSERLLPHWR